MHANTRKARARILKAVDHMARVRRSDLEVLGYNIRVMDQLIKEGFMAESCGYLQLNRSGAEEIGLEWSTFDNA